jgi:hypothetical protein
MADVGNLDVNLYVYFFVFRILETCNFLENRVNSTVKYACAVAKLWPVYVPNHKSAGVAA